MKEFHEYLAEARISGPHGIFIKLTPTTDSILTLVDRFPEINVNDLHCTLVYTKEPFYDVKLPELKPDDKWYGAGHKLEYFDGFTKVGFIILHLESSQIKILQKKFFEAGFPERSDFSESKPHVTLVTPAKKEDWEDYMKEHNHILETQPLHLQFVYGGYALLDENTKDD